MNIEELLIEKDSTGNYVNEALKDVPAYLRDYPNFYKFIKLVSNYIYFTGQKEIEKVYKYLSIDNAIGDPLEKLASKLNLALSSSSKYSKVYMQIITAVSKTIPIGTIIKDSEGNTWTNKTAYEVPPNSSNTYEFQSTENTQVYVDANNNRTYTNWETTLTDVEFQNPDESINDFDTNLKIAILGSGLKRKSDSGRENLISTILSLFKDIKKVELEVPALAIRTTEQIVNPMTANITIYGEIGGENANAKTITEIIEQYILPKITGIQWNITYIKYGSDLFAFDKDEPLAQHPEKGYGQVGWDLGVWAEQKLK